MTHTDVGRTVPRVVIAIVSWNTRDLLADCLRSLAPDVHDGFVAVWVVDNGSTDGSVGMVRSKFPWATVEVSGSNIGFGPAINVVAARTRSEWIVAANADIRVYPGTVHRLIHAGAVHPTAAAVAPALMLPDGSLQTSTWPFPRLFATLLVNLGVHRLRSVVPRGLELERYSDPSRERYVGYAMGAFLAIRREAFEAIGGFDERQWMYAEDLDLCWRLARAGWKTRYVPEAQVFHNSGAAATQAFGDEGAVVRSMGATYAWLARRRGRWVMWCIAMLNLAGAAGRLVPLSVAVRLSPRRFAGRYHGVARWLRINRAALELRRLAERPVPPS
jgi:N-acetylglucosaminyl-diphospho-decaprenol L-rhamnosyltransferase